MAVTQELAGVGEKFFCKWYFQHKNIHEVNLQLNQTNFKSLSILPLSLDKEWKKTPMKEPSKPQDSACLKSPPQPFV